MGKIRTFRKCSISFHIFSHFLFIFFLMLVFRVSGLPTRRGPVYAPEFRSSTISSKYSWSDCKFFMIYWGVCKTHSMPQQYEIHARLFYCDLSDSELILYSCTTYIAVADEFCKLPNIAKDLKSNTLRSIHKTSQLSAVLIYRLHLCRKTAQHHCNSS